MISSGVLTEYVIETLLESSLSRPFNTFDSIDLYPSIVEKAAALIESLIKNHAFVDGNKRIGYTIMRLFLLSAGFDIEAKEDEKYKFVISIAEGQLEIEAIRDWINAKLKNQLANL